jgi:isoamylase
VPMFPMGDEIGRTQNGNNNAYCQDNESSWLNWAGADKELVKFVQKLIQLRKDHPIFSRRSWFTGKLIPETDVKDIAWFMQTGREMEVEEDWNVCRCLGVYLDGRELRIEGDDGSKITDSNFFIIFNAHHEQSRFKLPEGSYAMEWKKLLDTAHLEDQEEIIKEGMEVVVEARSVQLLIHSVK